MNRRDKTNYYLDISETVSERGTCLRRNFGAIIVQIRHVSLSFQRSAIPMAVMASITGTARGTIQGS